MAKPRIFISSTCFDLTDIRTELTTLLQSYSFEVLNSQLKNFGVTPKKHSHSACIDQVKNSDYFILIIGGRRGGTFIGSEHSITNEEYNYALGMNIPIIVFVNKRVNNALPLYKKNTTGDFSDVVDDKRIFHFIDYIRSASEDNWIHEFENIKDIKETLISQFAYYLLLFSKSLNKKNKQDKSNDSSKLSCTKFPTNLEKIKKKKYDQMEETYLRNGLKELHKIMSKILNSGSRNDTKLEKIKCLWVFGRYGKIGYMGESLEMNNDVFKEYAWSSSKGQRVFNQLEQYGISGYYDVDEENANTNIEIRFENDTEEAAIADSLQTYVADLVDQYGEQDGLKLFQKADMRLYMV